MTPPIIYISTLESHLWEAANRLRGDPVDADLVDCVLGPGANLFYNSPMEACVEIRRQDKSSKRRGRVIFIDAVGKVVRERNASFLKAEHQKRIANAYHNFKDIEGFARVASTEEIRVNHSDLSILLYARTKAETKEASVQYEVASVKGAIEEWQSSSDKLDESIAQLLQTLNGR